MAAVANEAPFDGGTGHYGRKDPTPRSRSYGTANGHPIGTPGSATPDEDLSLPPADHGTAAWLFLAGCFWLEFLVWGTIVLFPGRHFTDRFVEGLPFSFGAFEKYYSNHVEFSSERGVAAIGTTCMVGFSPR